MGARRDGSFVLLSGAMDIGQGSTTVLAQMAADGLGVPLGSVTVVSGDTDRTPDAGKTSASRQTFVSGNAALRAAEDLRRRILTLAEVGDSAVLDPGPEGLRITDGASSFILELDRLTPDDEGCVLVGEGTYDPITTTLDADGQGSPYETYAFGAQIAVVDVDAELGRTYVRRIVAAHDVGRAVNPTLVEGQIHGGVAQGIGMALMEEYVAGRTDNLHDYLIPTIGDVPAIECHLIEDPEPAGPFGAKGVGEPALIATAPAILSAIRDAVGVRVTRLPATPDRLRAAILALSRQEDAPPLCARRALLHAARQVHAIGTDIDTIDAEAKDIAIGKGDRPAAAGRAPGRRRRRSPGTPRSVRRPHPRTGS